MKNERYTPIFIVHLLTEALGEIDLDPVSDPDKRIPAKHHITEAENCLITSWGNARTIYMNPPYSNAHPFLEKLVDHLSKHPHATAITLTHEGLLHTRSQPLFSSHGKAFCFYKGRINFDVPSGSPKGNGNNLNSLFTLWGDEALFHSFLDVFEPFGIVLRN
jgi:phage N-6-adenine-methyltransferase